MKTSITFPTTHADLENFSRIIPKNSHLAKLANLPPLAEQANRRTIHPDICSGEIMGYSIYDYHDNEPRGMKYFPIGELDSMQDK